MNETKKEELLTLFIIILALVACSVLIYMSRNPSITGQVVLNDQTIIVSIVSLLILAGLALVIGSVITIHKLNQEKEMHKKASLQNKTILMEHPNMNIVNYVMNARIAGFKESEIIKKLQEKGWSKEIIKKYL